MSCEFSKWPTGYIGRETVEPDTLLLAIHTHIDGNLRFADAKALAFVVIDSGVIASLFSNRMVHCSDANVGFLWASLLSITSCLCLAAGVVCNALVVWPRGLRFEGKARSGRLTLSSRIAKYSCGDRYFEKLMQANADCITTNLAESVVVRSKIERAKYGYLKWGIGVSAVALLVASVSSIAIVGIRDHVPGV